MEGYTMSSEVFRVYDIRGLVDKELTEEVAENIGKALGTFLNGEQIIIGYDVRESSKKIHNAFTKGALSTGCDVSSIGASSSPTLFFNCWQQKKFGVIVTSSHNPCQYNGFKFVDKDGCSFVDEYSEIKKIFEKQNFAKGKGQFKEINGVAPYTQFLASQIKIKKPIKVVVECLHASAGLLTPFIFRKAGLETIPLNSKPSPTFNNSRPEPKGENLGEMRDAILKNNADFGVALDGDADRSVMVDDKGRELNGSVSSAVFIKAILPEKKGAIVMTVDCNSELKQLVESLGGKLIWSEVGHGFIGKAVHDNKALYGGEMSSHMWFDLYPFSDGFLSGLKMAELLSKTDKKLSELVDEIDFAPMLKEYINCDTHQKKEAVLKKLVEIFSKKHANNMILRDGIKFFLNDLEWVYLRKSNNLPEVCIVIEAKNQQRLQKLHKEYRKVIDEAIANT
jgi:phosphomannomutase/phosphoglucomutase